MIYNNQKQKRKVPVTQLCPNPPSSVSLWLCVFCFVMNSQPSSCLGCFSGSELAQSGPIWSMGRWANWAPPSPTPSLPKRETCSPVFSTFQNTAAMQQSAQKQPGACQICMDTAHSLALGRGGFFHVCVCCCVLFCLWIQCLISLLREQMISFDSLLSTYSAHT